MNKKNEWFKLRKSIRIFLFCYLLLLLLSSMSLSIYSIANLDKLIETYGIKNITLFCSIIFSLMGGSLYYIRKLYKACINLDVVNPIDENDNIRETGVFLYFFLRPIFSIVLSIIFFVSMMNLMMNFVESPKISSNFPYTIMFLTFFVGYSAGNVIDKFEKMGKEIINKNFDK